MKHERAHKRIPATKSPGRPKGGNSEDTKRAILNAARVCFADYGYSSTSNKQIARLANVTPASIYHYFEKKSDMFLEVHKEIQAMTISRLRMAIAGKTDLLDAVDSIFDELLSQQKEDPSFSKFNTVVRIEASRNREIDIAMEDSEWRSLYAQLAALGVASGRVRPEDERAVRSVFATIILGLAHHGSEASPAAHRDALNGFKRLLHGQLWALSPKQV
jgi:AcrR family transcriptional regulator